MTDRPAEPGLRVLVWRRQMLPGSETFITGQAAAMARWRPSFAGLTSVDSPLSPAGALVLDRPSTPAARLDRAVFSRTGVSARLLRALRRPGLRLAHAHFVTDAYALLTATRLARRPLVVTAHGYDVTTSSVDPAELRAVFAQAHVVIAVSQFIAGRLADLGARDEQITVLPIGIAVPPDIVRDPPLDPRIVFVGRLVDKKGCADLLTAVAALGAPLRATPITIVGDGPLRRELEAQAARLGLDVRFAGALAPDAVRAQLQSATVFCVPSRTAPSGDAEGFGMVFLEAAAARLPVVSYASGGVPEAVADGTTGVLAPEGDIAGLTAALGTLLSDPERARAMGDAGRSRVAAHFDIADCTQGLEALYDDVARGAGRAPA